MAPYVGAPEIKARRLVLAVEYHGQIGNPGVQERSRVAPVEHTAGDLDPEQRYSALDGRGPSFLARAVGLRIDTTDASNAWILLKALERHPVLAIARIEPFVVLELLK